MVEINEVEGSRTPKGFCDFSRPQAMEEADNVFSRICHRQGETPNQVIATMSALSLIMKGTTMSDLDTLWERVEKALYDGNSLPIKGKTAAEQLQTAFSLFYSALDVVDAKATSTAELSSLRDLYYEVRHQVESRLLPNHAGKEKRILQRILKTVDNRFTKVVKQFNARVEAGSLEGSKLVTA